eukprot:TRINITY_DN2220_c0_g2_i1.p1 TRINITY_DN2220_c0_g2~~TRINITY_DN2220_c0_g2_i1.p1  ORF type:complete len:435 (+),score=56.50 TRINITY_DN2220_c0_g2_i1:170-1306(+)
MSFNVRGMSGRRASARSVIRPARVAVRYKEDKQFAAPTEPHMSEVMSFSNHLEALRSMSKVVADTGDVEKVKQYQPVDATTNPSLVLKAVQMPEYQHYLKKAIEETRAAGDAQDSSRPYAAVADRLAVNIGSEVLDIVPGRVSTEVDAHLSYDTEATIAKARKIIELYEAKGIGRERIYVKMASTWEGIEACRVLEKEGINCNMTLLFSFAQAVACANAGATLISPFVGRIMDWYKAKEGRTYTGAEDPGVQSVTRIYRYYKAHGVDTIVMAASFRNIGEIQELAGCDNITIAPALLQELQDNTSPLPRKLTPASAVGECQDENLSHMDEALFREMHGQDQMAVDKLDEGIRNFAKDQDRLEEMLAALAEESEGMPQM